MNQNVVPLPRSLTRVEPPPERAVYTVPEVAIMLGVSRSTGYELVHQGVIPAERLGRRLVVPKARFDAWLNSLGEARPATTGRAS